MRTLISQLFQLLLFHTTILLLHLTLVSLLVYPAVPIPQERINQRPQRNHAERDCMTTHVARLIFLGTVKIVSKLSLSTKSKDILDER